MSGSRHEVQLSLWGVSLGYTYIRGKQSGVGDCDTLTTKTKSTGGSEV